MTGTNMDNRRVSVFFERHIGIGVRWAFAGCYWLDIAISIPFLTMQLGIGKEQ